MLKVTVELLPYGREEGRRVLYELDIANDATGNYAVADYMARHPGEEWVGKVVVNHDRKRPVSHLVWRAIKNLEEPSGW